MGNIKRALTFIACTAIAACTSADDSSDESSYGMTELAPSAVVLQVGADLPEAIAGRLKELLTGRVPNLSIAGPDESVQAEAGTLVLAVGETTSTRQLIRASERKPEGVLVR